jgi:hypothetical protein
MKMTPSTFVEIDNSRRPRTAMLRIDAGILSKAISCRSQLNELMHVLKEQTISIGKTMALKNILFRTIFTMLLAAGDARRQIAAPKRLVGSCSFSISAERSIKSKLTPTSNIAFGSP